MESMKATKARMVALGWEPPIDQPATSELNSAEVIGFATGLDASAGFRVSKRHCASLEAPGTVVNLDDLNGAGSSEVAAATTAGSSEAAAATDAGSMEVAEATTASSLEALAAATDAMEVTAATNAGGVDVAAATDAAMEDMSEAAE